MPRDIQPVWTVDCTTVAVPLKAVRSAATITIGATCARRTRTVQWRRTRCQVLVRRPERSAGWF
eukprot:9495330-Pyramimonas_sp.AAC.1